MFWGINDCKDVNSFSFVSLSENNVGLTILGHSGGRTKALIKTRIVK